MTNEPENKGKFSGLRPGDNKVKLAGKVIWIIGRGGCGKSTLIRAIRQRLPQVIALDDHLRVRVGIWGRQMKAYQMMVGLAYSLAYQGFDVLVPCGAGKREIRDYIRANIPSSIMVYIPKRGRRCNWYEEPKPGESDIFCINPQWTIEQELKLILEHIWKIKSTKNSGPR